MKAFLLLLLALITTFANVTADSLTNFAIGLSSAYAAPESEQIERSVKKFILEASKGGRVRIDDGFNLRSIVVFIIPDARYDSPANRVRVLAQPLTTLTLWFRQARTNLASGVLTNTALIRVPEYLDFLAADSAGQSRAVMLIGTPLVVYPTEPTFSMTGGEEGPCVPSDGHLLATVTSTPYGCAERRGRLRGYQISWCYGSENVWSNGLHKTLVTRFWTLFTKQQDAALVSFTADLGAAFAALPQSGRGAVANFDLNPDQTKIEMLVARPRQVPMWLPQVDAATNMAAPVAVVPQRVATVPPGVGTAVAQSREPAVGTHPGTPPLNLATPVTSTMDIGLMWTVQADVDLYVRARPSAAELSYQRVRTPEGAHIHDWTQANSATDFEWVKLNPGVRFGEIEAWANLYRGSGPVSGRVAVHYQNRVYTGSFTIPAASGNGGIDAAARATSPNWTRLNLQQILTQNQ